MDSTTVYILLVMFVASLVRSAFGFGEALVAVPLLAMCIPLRVAAPMAVLMSITVAAIILLQDWQKIQFRSAGLLIASSVVGIPIGLFLLTHGNEQLVRLGLGAIIIAFSIYCLSGKRIITLAHEHLAWVLGCGFIAGILGGAYGLNGPPLVIYGTMRRWSAQHFRATLQAYFFPASMLGMAGYWAAGLWTAEVTRTYLIALPAVIPAVLLGRYLNQRMHRERFYKYVYAGLLVVGITFLVQAI